MRKAKNRIKNLIEPAVARVAGRSSPYFWKSSIYNEVLKTAGLAKALADIETRHARWGFHERIKRDIDHLIGQALRRRDPKGLRVYECYRSEGESERRWFPFRAMTADTLRAVMRATRTQERSFHIKGEAYHIMLEALEALGKPDATVDDVYDAASLRIAAYKSRA